MVRVGRNLAARAGVLAGLAAALYVIPGCSSKQGADLASLAVGDMKALKVDAAPTPAPQVTFTDGGGKPHTLADFKGKAVVLNIWGTFCAPCVAEMPTLAKLETETAGQPLVVLPVSVDTEDDRANAEAFIAKRPPLPFYSDPKYGLAYGVKPPIEGMPTTLLIDRDGNVRARLAGGADWSGQDALHVVQALEKLG